MDRPKGGSMTLFLFAVGALLLFFDLWFILTGLGHSGIGLHILTRLPWIILWAALIYLAYRREKVRTARGRGAAEGKER